MKQLIYILLIGILFTACKKDKTTGIQPVDLNINVAYNIQTSGYTLPVKDIIVKIKNVNTGTTQTLNTNEKGEIVFGSIAAGTYDIDASIKIDARTYTQLTGIETASDITFNASSKNKQIVVGFTDVVELKLVAGSVNDWVIKQIYYAGSHRNNGATFRDQFIEFYNNGDQTLYADSLY
ncbi:MAG: carboxypeptidase regulatory-like domain-containing protein, partial [Flavobacterium sp.]